ncbi:DUF305 domain-containing protein [Nocardia carnea]|uniref:DUF305 domain-containing protein n=1 Tax=Nocardia carnea TaxID=37328 RepID=A0ABW7TJ10_9NOCA|nr:DUF305 domain-containing protein [Nocardia carnea]
MAETTRRLREAAAYSVAAVLLLVLGAAIRPLFTDDPAPPEILSAVELGFVQDMAAHHHQALIMVQRLDPGADPAVRGLAQQIDDIQRAEIGMLLGWVRMAGAPAANSDPMGWMPDESHDSHRVHDGNRAHNGHGGDDRNSGPATSMPGMATQEQLDALSAARGRAASVLFLQLMQAHHEGGVAMARVADAMLAGGVVKQVAREMIGGQTQESGLIALLLNRLEAAPLG